MILLDTDHLTVLAVGAGQRCVRLVARMEAAGNEVFGTTIINAAEQQGKKSASTGDRLSGIGPVV